VAVIDEMAMAANIFHIARIPLSCDQEADRTDTRSNVALIARMTNERTVHVDSAISRLLAV